MKELKHLHLYLGAECMVKYHYSKEWVPDKITIVLLYEFGQCGGFSYQPEIIKPALRLFGDITIDEAIEIADELGVCTSNSVMWFTDAINGGIKNFNKQVEFINALRKRYFDCDGLIDAGLAIDKTTLK